jgi:4-amino-4-deoxy-L-arabinose transferase-like glycosyltransferase
MSQPARRLNGPIALLIIIGLGFALRLTLLDAIPLRGDEAFPVQYWTTSFTASLDLLGIDPQPYAAYVLLAGWRDLLGDGEWIMRSLLVLTNTPGIAAMYALGRRMFHSKRGGLLAALLFAIHPFMIWHAQDVHNYAIVASTAAIALWAFVMAVERNRPRDWVLYGVTTTLATYIFFLHPFLVLAQAVYLLIYRRGLLHRWFITMIGLGLACLPWLVQLYTAATSTYGGTAGRFLPEKLVTWFLPVFLFGNTLPDNTLAILGIVLLVGAGAALWIIAQRRADQAIMLLIGILIPAIILSMIAAMMNVFRPRYIIGVVPYVILITTGGVILAMRRQNWRRWAGIALLLVILFIQGASLLNYFTDPAYAKAPDWRTLSTFLVEHTTPDDLVIQQRVDPAMTYYFRGPAAETTLPSYANAPAAETITALEGALATRQTIWLIPGALPGYDDDQVPLTWLTENTQLTADLRIADFRVMAFEDWAVTPDEYPIAEPIAFDNVAVLLGWQIDQLVDRQIRLTVYWQR